MAHNSQVPRAAATVPVVRDAVPGGIEVLLLKRPASTHDITSGAWVFPGGVVEDQDREGHAFCTGLDDQEASRRMGVARGGLDYYVAAIRECFEECGLLVALVDSATPADPAAGRDPHLFDARNRLRHGEWNFAALCREHTLRFIPSRLAFLSHWITPAGLPKRFDTRFFLAAAPCGQRVSHDGAELVDHVWIAPAAALERGATLQLPIPTRSILSAIAGFDSVASLFAWAHGLDEIPVTLPRMGTGRAGKRVVLPTEAAWAEIGRLDPDGRADALYEIEPGRAVRLSDRVIRLTAHNGGPMTGPGTNSYLVGGGTRNEWAVLDPGPADPVHIATLIAAAPGPIRWVFATHTHQDHSPAAHLLHSSTGAEIRGMPPHTTEWQDLTFHTDKPLAGGERLRVADNATLAVIHTPGHASNHLCYLLEEEKLLFSGDHVMQGSSVVINPPDGDMSAYLESLRSLLDVDLEWIAPGHGFLIADPHRALRAIIRHREQREAKVFSALAALGTATGAALLARVYDDVPERLHGVAARSLLAHLQRLEARGMARRSGDRWVPAA